MWANDVDTPATAERLDDIEARLRGDDDPTTAGTRCSASRPPATRRPRPSSSTGATSPRRSSRARWTCTPRYGGVVPELAGRAHLELLTPVVARALPAPGLGDRARSGPRPRRGGGHRRARAHRLAAGRGERGQGPGPRLGRALRRGEPPRGPPLRRPARAPEPRVAARRPSRLGRAHDGRRHGRARPLPPPRRHPRRRRRGGLRQGGPVPRPGLPRRPGHRGRRRAAATPRPSPSPGPCSTRVSTSPSAGSRRRWSAPCGPARRRPTRTWPRRSSRRWSTCWWPRRAAAAQAIGARGICLAGGVAANGPLRAGVRAAARELGVPAYLPSRAMCTDNAAMVAAAGWWQLGRGRAHPPRRRRRPQPAAAPAGLSGAGGPRRLHGAAVARSRGGRYR